MGLLPIAKAGCTSPLGEVADLHLVVVFYTLIHLWEIYLLRPLLQVECLAHPISLIIAVPVKLLYLNLEPTLLLFILLKVARRLYLSTISNHDNHSNAHPSYTLTHKRWGLAC